MDVAVNHIVLNEATELSRTNNRLSERVVSDDVVVKVELSLGNHHTVDPERATTASAKRLVFKDIVVSLDVQPPWLDIEGLFAAHSLYRVSPNHNTVDGVVAFELGNINPFAKFSVVT